MHRDILNQQHSKLEIKNLISLLKTAERDVLLFVLLVGAAGYFASSRLPGITPLGYLSPQMLYVVCKVIGIKVQSLD
jgi:hypothetical protein